MKLIIKQEWQRKDATDAMFVYSCMAAFCPCSFRVLRVLRVFCVAFLFLRFSPQFLYGAPDEDILGNPAEFLVLLARRTRNQDWWYM